MFNLTKKLVLYALLVTIPLQPLLSTTAIQAADETDGTVGSVNVDADTSEEYFDPLFQGDSSDSQPTTLPDDAKYDWAIDKPDMPSAFGDAMNQVFALNPDPDKKLGLGLENGLSINRNPRLVINPSDFTAIKTLGILGGSDVVPDFTNEFQVLFDNLSGSTKEIRSISTADDLKNLKLSDPDGFEAIIHEAQTAWLKENGGDIKELVKTKPDLISKILGISIDEANSIVNYQRNDDSDEVAAFHQKRYEDLMRLLDDAIAGLKIDLRVLKLLNYLVTPKSQGGAGHWRIQVRTILAGYSSPRTQFKKESDISYNAAVDEELGNANRTAADIGQNRDASQNSAENGSAGDPNQTTAEVPEDDSPANKETNEVDSYEASFTNSGTIAEEADKRISVHSNGEAVDIAQIDDIRCTLIKKKRVGGDSKSKYSQRPIKLAWQTSQGYIDSGGQADQNADMAKILKDYAQDGIRDLIEQFGGDISNYNGDLSSASFSDVAMLLGKSLFGEVLNSPGGDLKGYNFGDTLKKLGAMYFADYLGLPREMFIDRHYDNLDQFEEAIGAAAIEKRMGLPIGTFDGDNLNAMLKNIGQRKIEYEMNLRAHDLDLYFAGVNKSPMDVNQRTLVIGAAVIESELSLLPGSYLIDNQAPANFADLKKAIGKYKSDIIFKDPTYVDGVLHLDPGTTKKLTSSTMSPAEFANIIGKKRLDDTVYGLQFLGMNDAAYEIPTGTFQKVLDGDSDALIDIGIAQMAKVFTTTDLERAAFTQWVKANKDSTSCNIPDNLEVTNVATVSEGVTTTTEKVVVSEAKALAAGLNSGDMFALFGCSKSSGRAIFNRIGSNILYFAIIQQALNPEDKIRLNLTELNPVIRSSDPQTQFYINRIYTIIKLKNQIKSNWEAISNDPQYILIKNAVNGITSTIDNIVSNPANITDIASAKLAARNLAVSINSFSGNLQQIQAGANRYRNKINGMLIDVQNLVKAVSEIMEGREIKTTNMLTLNQIPTGAFGGVSTFTNQSTAVLNKPVGQNTKTGIKPTNIALMAILARKLSPVQFFTNLAATKIEGELNLPANSIIYFVNNYESKGLGTVDSFVAAAGQARIEEEFGMPANYFQGPILTGANFALARPDFRNDLYALEQYLDPTDLSKLTLSQTAVSSPLTKSYPSLEGTGQLLQKNDKIQNQRYEIWSKYDEPSFADQYKDIFSTDGVPNTELTEEQQRIVATERAASELLWLKISEPKVFNSYVAKAEKNFAQDMQTLIDTENLNEYLENDIEHVVTNITNFKLNDASRSPGADLLFRMGITGSLEALMSDSSVAWLGANARASQIDRLFGIAQGSTKSLLTSKKVSATYSRDSLTPDEKNLLVARMGVTSAALDKLLDVLSGNLPASELDKKALDIVAVGDNRYLKSDTTDVSSDDCSISFTEQNGFVTSSTIVMNSYLYVDNAGTHSFGSQTAALNYAQMPENVGKQITYKQQLVNGIFKLYGAAKVTPTFDVSDGLQNFISDTSQTAALSISDSNYAAIQQKTGVTKDMLAKLFSRSDASDITRPLVAYKKAVGREVLFQTLSFKLFGDLGLRITRESFHTSDFFDIMHGNFKSLEKIAGSLIDDQLDLPQGSTQSILFASSSASRTCALAEVGGNVLGRYLGIDYVSLHGNIYQNLGRSNLERILKVPKNTFAGKNIDELLNSLGEINFVNAFSVPIDRLNFEAEFANFFDHKTVEKFKSYSNQYKLQMIQNLISANAGMLLITSNSTSYKSIRDKLKTQIKYAAANIVEGGAWRKNDYQLQYKENKGEINKFIVRVDSLDATFRIPKFTTANMLAEKSTSYTQEFTCPDSGVITQLEFCKASPAPGSCGCAPGKEVTATLTNTVITPNDYVSMVANTSALDFLLLRGMEFFGFDREDPRNQAIVNIIKNIRVWITEGNAGYANLFQNLSTIFSINLDEKAGLDNGTFRAIIENPGNTFAILMPQATRKIDQQLSLDPNETWSVSGVYRTYLSPYVDAPSSEEYRGRYPGIGMSVNAEGKPILPRPTLNTGMGVNGELIRANTPAELAFANFNARAGECAYSEADQALINDLDNRAKAIEEWKRQKGLIVLIDQETASGHLVVTQPSDFRNTQAYRDKVNELGAITVERTTIDRKYNACKEANRGANSPFGVFLSRFNWETLRSIAEDWASDYIHNLIFEKTGIYMPGEHIKRFFTHGDMRYFWAAGIAYTANIVIDAANPNKTVPLPPAYHLSYDDILLATMSDHATEEYAADAATWDYLNNDGAQTYSEALVNYKYGDLCYESGNLAGSALNCLLSQNFNSTNNTITGSPRDAASLTAFDRAIIDKIYKFDAGKQIQAQNEYDMLLQCAVIGDNEGICEGAAEKIEDLDKIREQARAKIRNDFRESMQFRIFDGIFWGKDHNIYPGFTYALVKGNSSVKAQAIATYLKNGIINGEFFGQEIPWLKQFEVADKLGVLSILSFANDIRNGMDRQKAFDIFATSAGFSWLNNYISSNSEKWFGFHIDPTMAGGLVLGGLTGHWGSFTNSDPDNNYKGLTGKLNIPTLGSAVFRLGSSRLFAWADTQLGWAPGTSQKIYDFGKAIYDMTQTVKQIDIIAKAMRGGSGSPMVDALALQTARANNPAGAAAIDAAGGDPSKAKIISKQIIGTMVVDQVSTWITSYIMKTFGKQIAAFEEKYGLVPGSTQILIGAAVSYQVSVVVYHNTSLLASAPTVAMLWVALAMFVLVNLFGVYKVELKCSADGYYPEIESPSPNLDSKSGLGVWDGLNPTVTQQKTVAAAQYKAKQLIIDSLNMHNNPNYKDIYPSQIMTARDEDVLALNQQIADNMCSVIEKSMPSVHGICGGNSLAGVWYDSYVANRGYTHVGF